MFFMFDYDTKENEHQNNRQSDLYSEATPPRVNQIASCFDALSITKHALHYIILKNGNGLMKEESDYQQIWNTLSNFYDLPKFTKVKQSLIH
jgi:hypothetical protein